MLNKSILAASIGLLMSAAAAQAGPIKTAPPTLTALGNVTAVYIFANASDTSVLNELTPVSFTQIFCNHPTGTCAGNNAGDTKNLFPPSQSGAMVFSLTDLTSGKRGPVHERARVAVGTIGRVAFGLPPADERIEAIPDRQGDDEKATRRGAHEGQSERDPGVVIGGVTDGAAQQAHRGAEQERQKESGIRFQDSRHCVESDRPAEPALEPARSQHVPNAAEREGAHRIPSVGGKHAATEKAGRFELHCLGAAEQGVHPRAPCDLGEHRMPAAVLRSVDAVSRRDRRVIVAAPRKP